MVRLPRSNLHSEQAGDFDSNVNQFRRSDPYSDLTTRHRAEEFQIGDNRSIPAARISYSQLLPGCRLTTDKPTFFYVGS
jgi:hypothetical protein